MALNSAMYAAVTGLSALSTGMQTVSNNLANVNTVGFKASRTNYEDLISQDYVSGGTPIQKGTGVKVSSIQSLFTQGALATSGQDTDLAIAGEGFFAVRNKVNDEVMYTRAGNFSTNKDGVLQDPSGNVLQGWEMSIPKPGEESVRIGAPTDIEITVMTAPPKATSQIKIVTNLNADDTSAFKYDEHQLAVDYADAKARPIAESARNIAHLATWNPPTDKSATAPTPAEPVPVAFSATKSSKPEYDKVFIDNFKKQKGLPADATPTPFTGAKILSNPQHALKLTPAQRAEGYMSKVEFDALVTQTNSNMEALAETAGKNAFTTTYDTTYDAEVIAISSQLEQWQLEGNGFAGTWNGGKMPPIAEDGYNHPEPISIYDSLGNEHKMMIYYQKNPTMENVWDYIITTDPAEDARKDADLQTLFETDASFAGLVQKGKITFTSDGDDRHGGVIKDIEAQNLDLSKCQVAEVDPLAFNSAASSSLKGATIGGYYTGSPIINPQTGAYESAPRTYTISWGTEDTLEIWGTDYNEWKENQADLALATEAKFTEATGRAKPTADKSIWYNKVDSVPVASGFTWFGSDGSTGNIAITDKNYSGPYEFGSGLSVSFNPDQLPLGFGAPGTEHITAVAHSEEISWTNLQPNKDGLFDFDVAFVQSASMATHPPYPDMPTISQTVAFDMGARYNKSNPKWVTDDLSTTQYAASNSTAFSGQDGFATGSLQRVSVGEDGVVTGIYSNGTKQPLYMVGLTRFLNPWGLAKEGGNLFSTTSYSGDGVLNAPGNSGTGTVMSKFLEQSNVNTADEIVNMIITQRGFQANSKTITTVDTMLSEVIDMKR